MRLVFTLTILSLLMALNMGCSSNADLTAASDERAEAPKIVGGNGHCCLGLWEMRVDPAAKIFDVVKLREAALHLNALPLLEPPPLLNISVEYVEFISGTEVIADIGLRHPYVGLTEFTGFDVCGVLITNGSAAFGETGLVYAGGDNDTRLLNPDGYTRWWNPDDFPSDGTIFGYKDGLLGTPDGTAEYNTGLNAYRYYSDELVDIDDDILECTPSARGVFGAGQKNIRRFDIHLGGDGLVFNYAVDANWIFPKGTPPYTVPDDFPENANRPEAWTITVTEIENTLWNDGTGSGGNLSLSVDVYDHFNADLNTVIVQSPGNFTAESSSTPAGGGEGYSTYEIDITDATPDEDGIPLFFIIESESDGYGGKIPGVPICAYFTGSAGVESEQEECTPGFNEKWNYDLPGNGFVDSSLRGGITLADLDDDGTLEILIMAETINTLYCFDHEGNVEWTHHCPYVSSWYGAPAVGEFNGDGVLDVAVSNMDQSGPHPNKVYVLNGIDGSEIFTISGPDIFGCMPSLADVVGATNTDPPDGQLDIFTVRCDPGEQYNVCYNGVDGSVVWEARRQGGSSSTPALADFDGDGDTEVVAGGGYYGQAPDYSGICLLRGEANPIDDRLIWEADYGCNILAPSSLYDYTGDDVPDIIANDFDWTPSNTSLRCLNGADGSEIWKYNIHSHVSNPALGDLNGDGYPEIVVLRSPSDAVVALNGDPDASDRVLWIWTDPDPDSAVDSRGSVVLYDVTCDNIPDVITGITCWNNDATPPRWGRLWIIDGETGEGITSVDFSTDQVLFGAPAVGDIDNDGKVDVLIGTYDHSVLYAFCLNVPLPSIYSARPWPQYMCNIRNTGLYGDEF